MREPIRRQSECLIELVIITGLQATVLCVNYLTSLPQNAVALAMILWGSAAILMSATLRRCFRFSLVEFAVVALCLSAVYFMLTPGIHVHRHTANREKEERSNFAEEREVGTAKRDTEPESGRVPNGTVIAATRRRKSGSRKGVGNDWHFLLRTAK